MIGNYVYADGATNVRVTTAVDALTETVRAGAPRHRAVVPGHADRRVRRTRRGRRRLGARVADRRTSKLLRGPLRTLSGGRLLRRNYVPGDDPGINDCLVPQQGPNYALAKRLQRWRATSAARPGRDGVDEHRPAHPDPLGGQEPRRWPRRTPGRTASASRCSTRPRPTR